MHVSRKPHLIENEYYTVDCSNSGILWAMKIVKDKDYPSELGSCKFLQYKKLHLYYCIVQRKLLY